LFLNAKADRKRVINATVLRSQYNPFAFSPRIHNRVSEQMIFIKLAMKLVKEQTIKKTILGKINTSCHVKYNKF